VRAILIGPALDRARLRPVLAAAGIDVVGEAPTLAAARAADLDADAYVLATNHRPERLPETLTPRELQVLELLAEGLPNKAIAARLEISDQTVKFHVSSICGKLGAANRTDAVRRAVRRGLIAL
jgi:DNA-binding NarL/FixJ family response regulator